MGGKSSKGSGSKPKGSEATNSPPPDYDYLLKIKLIGDSGVGKSCTILRFVDDTFTDSFSSTIGIDFKVKTIQAYDKTVKLQIWDTCAQQRFRYTGGSYRTYRVCHGFLVMYDTTDQETFLNIVKWLQEIERYALENVHKILVGTKSDLIEERAVDTDIAQAFANKFGMEFIEISSKDAINVNETFILLAAMIIKKIDE